MSTGGTRSRVTPSALRGLEWVARVGPAPLPAVTAALGWSEKLGWRWSRQLVAAGWAERVPMTHGEGSLLVATAAGVEMAQVDARAAPRPASVWWGHLVACAWTAAWFTARGRPIQGPREVDFDESWRGEVSWRDGRGQHHVGHRPDLAWAPENQRPVAVEVELARKAVPVLEAILELHGAWRAAGQTAGVIYVCRDARGRERVTRLAGGRGLSLERGGGLRVELLADVREQAIDAGKLIRETSKAARKGTQIALPLPDGEPSPPAA